MDKAMSNVAFWGMSMMFKVRDQFCPPGNLITEIGLQSGDVVLDYGCGPGSFMEPVVQAIGSTGKYYGLDLHPKAVARVNILAKKHGYRNIQTIQSDHKTGLADNSVDVVVLYDIYHMLGKPQAVLAELHRVMKPGGLLSVTDPHISAESVIQGVTQTGLFALEKQGRTFSFIAKERV